MLLNILLSILVIDAVALTGVILMQRSEGGALGMGGGGGAFLSARGAGDLLTLTTWIMAGLALVICVTITLITGHSRANSSVADRINAAGLPQSSAPLPAQQQPQPGPAGAAPAAPPLPGATPASPPPLPTEAPRPVVRAPVRPAPAARAAARPADALARIQIPRQGAEAPRIDPAAPASSTPQQ